MIFVSLTIEDNVPRLWFRREGDEKPFESAELPVGVIVGDRETLALEILNQVGRPGDAFKGWATPESAASHLARYERVETKVCPVTAMECPCQGGCALNSGATMVDGRILD